MSPKYTPEQYEARHLMLLEHGCLYRLILPHVVANIYNGGVPLAHALTKLGDEGFLVGCPHQLPGGRSFFLVSEKGCGKVGVSPQRATPLSGSSLDLAIGVSHFCGATSVRRYRLEVKEQEALLGMPGNLVFVVSDELGKEAKLFRVLHAVRQTPNDTLRKVRAAAEQMARQDKLTPLVHHKQLGVAVLCPTAGALEALKRLLSKSTLSQEVALICGLGPDAEHLSAALKSMKGK